jgi:hypothetical protein
MEVCYAKLTLLIEHHLLFAITLLAASETAAAHRLMGVIGYLLLAPKS